LEPARKFLACFAVGKSAASRQIYLAAVSYTVDKGVLRSGAGIGRRRRIVDERNPASVFGKGSTPAALLVLKTARRLRQRPLFGYAAALISVGAASLLQWLAQGQYAGAPFLTIYPAVIVATFVGGLATGFLAAVLAGVSQWVLFIADAHWLALASYAFDASVCVLLIVVINRTLDVLLVHIDQEKQQRQQQSMLARELHHRIQNLLTVIQAVIRFSLPKAGMVEASTVSERLTARLQSMAAANRAITESSGHGVDLADLIAEEIRGFEERVVIVGACGLALGPQMTQNFWLILHELLTNALKHGALSVPRGRIQVRFDWVRPVLTFSWQECDGPAVTPVTTAGFGSRILGSFARSFCQQVELRYAESGFFYRLQLISDQIEAPAPSLAASDSVAGAASGFRALKRA
jgi:two-component sensor histidine kinase